MNPVLAVGQGSDSILASAIFRGPIMLRTISAILLACTMAGATAATDEHPRWAVRVSSDGHAYFIDQPNCHPLAYFLNDTSRLNDHHILVRIQPGKTKDEAKSQSIGEIGGHTINQITHNINDGELLLKMLVVERRTDEFCEIYHQEWMGDTFYQEVLLANLVNVNSEIILATADRISGNGNWYDEHYWTFDKEGPIDLYVSEKIREIQKRLLPKDSGVMNGGGFNAQDLTYVTSVWGPSDGHCCPSGGRIEIKFVLKDHRLTVVDQKFDAPKE